MSATEAPLVKGRKAIPHLAESDDQAFAMIVALASELAMTRARLDTLERLLAKRGFLAPDAVEAFVPDAAAASERDALRRRIVAKIFRPVRDAARRAAEAEAKG